MKTHTHQVTLSTEDLFLMLLCAMRYALGRRSYIVSWVNEQLRTHARAFQPQHIATMIEDIERQEKWGSYGYGDDIDQKTWMDTLHYLKSLQHASQSEH